MSDQGQRGLDAGSLRLPAVSPVLSLLHFLMRTSF